MKRLELPTCCLRNSCCYQLSYIGIKNGLDQDRTDYPYHVAVVLYQMSYEP